MTEKRFKLEDIGFVRDNGKLIGMKDIVTVMNDLQDENEQLKSRIKYLERKIQRERNTTTKQHLKWSDEAETKIKELSEENEQLKKDLLEVHEICAYYESRIKELKDDVE